jgi:sterol desaturase/sphingolipid hydroxylase (fatty acid hydroxylase superfamily)
MEIIGIDAPIVFFAITTATFFLFAGLEMVVPFRRLTQPRAQRWRTNLALFAIDTLALRLLVPLALVGMAVLAEERGWGLLNQLDLPLWLGCVIAILALDLALWFQHWATHRVPVLWRLHRVHHVDRDFDVTTGARFHPFEIILSMGYKLAIVAALGPPALGVFLFEVVFTVATLFTHSNTHLPGWLDRPVRALIVTPDMHRIHHSARMEETNSNYSTFMSFWDRLFGTYVDRAEDGQRGLTIGLSRWQDDRPRRLGWSLWLPFLPRTGERD